MHLYRHRGIIIHRHGRCRHSFVQILLAALELQVDLAWYDLHLLVLYILQHNLCRSRRLLDLIYHCRLSRCLSGLFYRNSYL